MAGKTDTRVVLRVLVAGFALVVALLGLAGYVAVRGTRAIEIDAAQVGRQQLAMARLLNDVPAGQNTMAAILHQLAPGQDAIDREALLRELEAADRGLVKIASLATGTPEVERWQELSKAAREFSAGVRQSVQHGRTLRPVDLVPLFGQHDQVMRLQQKLLETSESQKGTIEQRLEAESRELAARPDRLVFNRIGCRRLAPVRR